MTKGNFSDIQKVQEDQYSFPHHYVPRYKDGFSTAVYSGFGINYVSTLEFLFSKLEDLHFGSLCDVGTGDGRLVREFSDHFPDKDVSGIDYSERAINLARGLNPGFDFIQADIVNDNLPVKYDVLTLIEVFEHIPPGDTYGFVKALHGLLNENGTLILTVPHKNKPLTSKHYQHFSSGGLKSHFEPLFEVEEEVFFEKLRHWRLFIIRRLLKNKLFILNNRRLLNRIYRTYKQNCFHADESNCGRIYLKLRKNGE